MIRRPGKGKPEGENGKSAGLFKKGRTGGGNELGF